MEITAVECNDLAKDINMEEIPLSEEDLRELSSVFDTIQNDDNNGSTSCTFSSNLDFELFIGTKTGSGNGGNVLEETGHVKGDNSKLLEILQEPTNHECKGTHEFTTFQNILQSADDAVISEQIDEIIDSSDLNLIQHVLTNDLDAEGNNDEIHVNTVTNISNNSPVSAQNYQVSPDSYIDSVSDSLQSPKDVEGDILGNNALQPNPQTSNHYVIIPVKSTKILLDKEEDYNKDLKEYLEPSKLSEEKKAIKVINDSVSNFL